MAGDHAANWRSLSLLKPKAFEAFPSISCVPASPHHGAITGLLSKFRIGVLGQNIAWSSQGLRQNLVTRLHSSFSIAEGMSRLPTALKPGKESESAKAISFLITVQDVHFDFYIFLLNCWWITPVLPPSVYLFINEARTLQSHVVTNTTVVP